MPLLHALRPVLPLLAALLLPAAGRAQEPLTTELLEVTRVVDGDTIYVLRDGQEEKLRLYSVDTEEKITGRPNVSPTKPETVFGEECALWAREFFAELAQDGEPARVRLMFPEGVEKRDVFGRLLCHVILPDGRDFNLLLVQLGKSPYFNKYGNSLALHEELVRAQAEARAKQLGIWNPATNTPKTPGAPAAKRPYDRLLPWWQARADAIDGFRARQRSGSFESVFADELDENDFCLFAAEDVDLLEGHMDRDALPCSPDVLVFGEIYRLHEEADGSLKAEFRSSVRGRALRAWVPPASRPEVEPLLRRSTEEFRQNFLFVWGYLIEGSRGPEILLEDPSQMRLAGPEPRFPVEAGAAR